MRLIWPGPGRGDKDKCRQVKSDSGRMCRWEDTDRFFVGRGKSQIVIGT